MRSSESMKVKLSDVCIVLNGRAYSQPELLNSGKYKVLRVGNLVGGDRFYYSDMELDDDKYCYEGDLLYAWACSFDPYIWKEGKTIFHYHIWKLLPKEDVLDKKFFYFYLKCVTQTLLGKTNGSVMQHITKSLFENTELTLPSLEKQKEIANILSTLDDKIELNNAINRNLEEQAQALFKSWFIDFEPFGGKMPEDWQTGKLSDIAEYEKDKIDVAKLNAETYYSTENMLPNKAGVSKAASLPTTEQTTRCIPGETIISNIRPYFKKIFYCTEETAGCSADVLCFKPKKESFSIYNYDLLYSDNFFDYMVKGSKGTKMPRGDKSQIMNYDVVIPAESVISDFNNVVSNILQQISNNKKENECLAKLRDTLLPDLMSGELYLNT